MKTASTNGAQQLRKLAQFLEDHPRFSPLFSDDAILCGFQLGDSDVSLAEMEILLGSEAEARPGDSLAAAETACVHG